MTDRTVISTSSEQNEHRFAAGSVAEATLPATGIARRRGES
jgi:hypothetical protein